MASLKRYLRSVKRGLSARTIDTPPTVLIWWGSYGYKGGPTVGDLLAVNNLSAKLGQRGVEHAVVSHPELRIPGHMPVADLYAIKPVARVVFVCGPIAHSQDLQDFISNQSGAIKVAVGVSVLANQTRMNSQFHHIVARDGAVPSYFDLAISETIEPARSNRFETVGVCVRGPQGEYGHNREGMFQKAETIIQDVSDDCAFRPKTIDTVLSPDNGLEVVQASFLSSDIVLTTRMHGALLALAAGKPVIAIDQVPGGAKVSAVVGKTGWPFVLRAETATKEAVRSMVEEIRTGDWQAQVLSAQVEIRALAEEALQTSVGVIAALAAPPVGKEPDVNFLRKETDPV